MRGSAAPSRRAAIRSLRRAQTAASAPASRRLPRRTALALASSALRWDLPKARFLCDLALLKRRKRFPLLEGVARRRRWRCIMRMLPVALGCLLILTGCMPPQPGHVAHAEYRPAPVRHEPRPAPRPAPPARRPANPAPRPEAHRPAPAPRPDAHVAPSRPGKPTGNHAVQRPSSPQKGHAAERPAPGKNDPGRPAPRR